MQFKNIVSVPGSDGVIVGVTNSLLGCSCEQHVVCGEDIENPLIGIVPINGKKLN